MFENSFTAEEKLQELLKQYGVTKTEEASDGLHFGYGISPKCVFCFHREFEDGSMFHGNENPNKNIRVEVFPDYDILRKNKKFFERMKYDCLEGGCYERLGKLVDWYENGTEKNAPHPADMYYSDSIDTIEDCSVWYLENDEDCFDIGSVVIDTYDDNPFIYAGKHCGKHVKQIEYSSYCGIDDQGDLIMEYSKCWCSKDKPSEIRLATEEEKEKFFIAIEKAGKCWNNETMTLEDFKPKCILKSFDRVVAFNSNENVWCADIFSHFDEQGDYACIGGLYAKVLTYNEETAKLIGTTDNYKENLK